MMHLALFWFNIQYTITRVVQYYTNRNIAREFFKSPHSCVYFHMGQVYQILARRAKQAKCPRGEISLSLRYIRSIFVLLWVTGNRTKTLNSKHPPPPLYTRRVFSTILLAQPAQLFIKSLETFSSSLSLALDDEHYSNYYTTIYLAVFFRVTWFPTSIFEHCAISQNWIAR